MSSIEQRSLVDRRVGHAPFSPSHSVNDVHSLRFGGPVETWTEDGSEENPRERASIASS